jgi:hypothetical protein
MKTIKNIKHIFDSQPQKVGDGFVGKNAFHPQNSLPFSPFLMLDHHGPMQVLPSIRPKGVDEHPHRGFETVTVVYEGALEHRDSVGNHGKLFKGDVQWMTAASGIIHEEKHEREFSKTGGKLEFIQLWVNLPAKYKMIAPAYQEISSDKFQSKEIAEGVTVRVIAGELEGLTGAAKTFSPVLLADATLLSGKSALLLIPENFNLSIYVLKGSIKVNQREAIKAGQIALFEIQGNSIEVLANEDSLIMLLGGEIIKEPVATYGPFVMNTREELIQAFEDFQSGKMGTLVN